MVSGFLKLKCRRLRILVLAPSPPRARRPPAPIHCTALGLSLKPRLGGEGPRFLEAAPVVRGSYTHMAVYKRRRSSTTTSFNPVDAGARSFAGLRKGLFQEPPGNHSTLAQK
jgi:hypothetical protein